MFRSVVIFTAACVLIAPAWGSPGLSKAEELFQQTEYGQSLSLLNTNSSDSAVQHLAGRNYYMLGDFRKATDCFLKATAAAPDNSEYMDWLGRAYGRRAEVANPVSAPVFATKARQAFERAVQLNGRNSEAMSDLFEYYLEAPGFLGGGLDKAAAISDKVAAFDAREALNEKARLAQKRKEFAAAERHYREAIAAAPTEPGPVIAFSKFLASQGRVQESEELLASAQQKQPGCPRLWFARADELVKQQRNLDEARTLLNKYVNAHLTVDDPPRQEALQLLKRAGGA